MRNEKGLTLVEVLGAIVLFGVAAMGIIFILQQSSLHTKANAQTDEAVVISRNVMERLKQELPASTASLTLYQQSLSLGSLRNIAQTTLYYPSTANRKYEIQIQSQPAQLGTAQAGSTGVNLDGVFRKVTVRTANLETSKVFQLESFIAYK
ncbi:prepilin-type N-terminal cleavage/methylation domain-containing protein [Paenibacillus sp. GCM10027627]|uniref:type IV pilus modification PilV family protein n=1 Tax=unclassified Paenibacillus TaxID=185978 RepID=UPI00363DA4E5